MTDEQFETLIETRTDVKHVLAHLTTLGQQHRELEARVGKLEKAWWKASSWSMGATAVAGLVLKLLGVL